MFTQLVNNIGEDEFWQKFLQSLSKDDAEKIMKMSNEQLEMGHNPDNIEERMKFIQKLPYDDKHQFLDNILFQLQSKEK